MYAFIFWNLQLLKKNHPKLQSAGSKKEEKKKKGKKGQSQGQQKSGRPVSGKQQLQQQGGTGQAKSVELILKPTAEIIIDGKKYSCINLLQKLSLLVKKKLIYIYKPTAEIIIESQKYTWKKILSTSLLMIRNLHALSCHKIIIDGMNYTSTCNIPCRNHHWL